MLVSDIIKSCKVNCNNNLQIVQKEFSFTSAEELNCNLNNDSWSIGECFDHLRITNNLYLSIINDKLSKVSAEEKHDHLYKHSFVGKMIIKAVHPKTEKKVKTFNVFQPENSKIDLQVIELYKKTMNELVNHLEKLSVLNLKEIKISSPVNGFLRMNLGDPLLIIPLHDKRHIIQAINVKKVCS